MLLLMRSWLVEEDLSVNTVGMDRISRMEPRAVCPALCLSPAEGWDLSDRVPHAVLYPMNHFLPLPFAAAPAAAGPGSGLFVRPGPLLAPAPAQRRCCAAQLLCHPSLLMTENHMTQSSGKLKRIPGRGQGVQ